MDHSSTQLTVRPAEPAAYGTACDPPVPGTSLLVGAARVLDANWTGASTVPSRSLYPHQWSWDSAFIAIGLRHVSPLRAQTELETLLAAQWADGRVPHIVFNPSVPLDAYFPSPDFWRSSTAGRAAGAPRTVQTSGIVQPPVHALAAWLVHRADPGLSRARGFLARMYPRLAAWHRYLLHRRDLGGAGLVSVVHPWEQGMDNSPCWDAPLARITPAPARSFRRADLAHGAPEDRPTDLDYGRYVRLAADYRDAGYRDGTVGGNGGGGAEFAVEDPAFNALLIASEHALARIAEELGAPGTARHARAERLTQVLVERLWDPASGMFLCRDLHADEPIHTRDVSARLPAPGPPDRLPAPSTSERVPVPDACGQLPAPGTSGQLPAPDASGQLPAPDASGLVDGPVMAGQSLAPGDSGRNPVPGASSQSPAPDAAGSAHGPGTADRIREPHPSGPAGEPVPTGQSPAPGTSGRSPAPGTSGRSPAPGTSGPPCEQGATGPTDEQGISGPAHQQGAPGPAPAQSATDPTDRQRISGPAHPQGAPSPAHTQGAPGPVHRQGGDGLIPERSVSGLVPLVLPGLPRHVVGALVRTLCGPHFGLGGRSRLVPSYDLLGEAFDPHRYWRGPAWFNTSWLLERGLRIHGERERADALRAAVLQLAEATGFAEYVDPRTGEACGATGFGWTAALALDLHHELHKDLLKGAREGVSEAATGTFDRSDEGGDRR
ncbi:MGH1-like glycoside hydrolase domain-containing protein [Streptomyces sp. NPDC001153]